MSSSSAAEKLPSVEEIKEDVAVATKKSLSSLRDFAAGGVGGIFAVVVGHPFDLVKVRLQTAEKGVYSGAMDVVRKTIAREGPIRVCAQLKHSCIANAALTIVNRDSTLVYLLHWLA
jgi:solute carrier family 25 (mitochondrial carnitine/acylcarnitine transporter), member 20/29